MVWVRSAEYSIKPGVTLVIEEFDGCVHCVRLKKELDSMGIPYSTTQAAGSAPITHVYENGKETGSFIGFKSEASLVLILSLKRKTP